VSGAPPPQLTFTTMRKLPPKAFPLYPISGSKDQILYSAFVGQVDPTASFTQGRPVNEGGEGEQA